MNIQRIFDAVDTDEMNSLLTVIVCELEKQDYMVRIEGLDVSSEDMENKLFEDLERATNEFEFELLKNFEVSQKFKLVFTNYHQFNFQPINKE